MSDEAEDAATHRWLSFCRLLMFVHPRVGAVHDGIGHGDRTHYHEGWNIVHPPRGSDKGIRYVFISAAEGRTTPIKPDIPDDQFTHVDEEEIPPLRSSRAWRKAREVAEILTARKLPDSDKAAVASQMASIESAAMSPLSGDTDGVERDMEAAVAHITRVVRQPGVRAVDVCEPAVDVVRAYLAFQRSGLSASNVLALILLYLMIRVPSPLSRTTDSDRVLSGADHLRDLTFSLLRERLDKTLSTFNEMTYLALLYGNTALLLYGRLLTGGPARAPEESQGIEQRTLVVDERMAHHAGAMTFLYPGWYCPLGPVEAIAFAHMPDTPMLYPGAREALQSKKSREEIWPAVQAYSRRSASVSVLDGLEGPFSPIGEDLRHHLMGHIVAIQMGQMRR